jgi:hypothetical protein
LGWTLSAITADMVANVVQAANPTLLVGGVLQPA